MSSVRAISRRIKSANNVHDITKALEMVSSSKMKKAIENNLMSIPYTQEITKILEEIFLLSTNSNHKLMNRNTTGKSVVILISTNKGLCGSMNTILFRSLVKYISLENLLLPEFINIGKKGEAFVKRSNLGEITSDFSAIIPASLVAPSIAKIISDGYINKHILNTYLCYIHFISPLKYEPLLTKLLPFEFNIQSKPNINKLIEPSADLILESLLVHYLEVQIRQAILESSAAEESSRMLSMKNASDNAEDLISALTLAKNTLRQQKITTEISDMITARMALNI